MIYYNSLKQNWRGLTVAAMVGVISVLINKYTKLPILDPLLVALLIGIIIRSFTKFNDKFISGFKFAPMLFIPIGVVLYGAINLNFVKFATVDPMIIFIILFTFLGNAAFIFFLSDIFGIRQKTTYLITAGSAICGASAIAITSDAVDAEPDDVSNSLVSVFITALFSVFIFLPFLASILKISGMDYSIMAGALLQFTGFVKEAVSSMPIAAANNAGDLMSLALSVKAVRYLGLLILIPLFSSFARGKFYIPLYLWAFLAAGVLVSFFPDLFKQLNSSLKLDLVLSYLWSTAMAAIGLNANFKILFSKTGVKTLAVTFISFLFATGIFLGMYIPLRELMF